MFGLSPKAKPSYSGLQVQTSVSTLPIPIAYGRQKFAPNLIWSNDFKAQPTKQSGGGKGGQAGTTQVNYTASIMMGLCEGPITGVGHVWIDTGTPNSMSTLANAELSLSTGAANQGVWGYLTSAHPTQALSYPSTAYVMAPNYMLGSSAQVPNHNMEVEGILSGSGINANGDADPALLAADFLTSAQYGVGLPASAIDPASWYSGPNAQTTGDASWQTYCRALSIDLSPALVSQDVASSALARWAALTNTALFFSGPILKAIPYGDEAVSGNGYVFTPDLTTVAALSDYDFVRTDGQDPLLITRSDQMDAYNCVRLDYRDRSNEYNSVTVESKDQASIELYGLRVSTTLDGQDVTLANVAQSICDVALARLVSIRNTFQFKLSAEWFLLEPMDLVTLTDPALGMTATVVRIVEVEEDDQGILTITAEEFPAGAATPAATANPTQTVASSASNAATPADPVNAPIFLEPPASLTSGIAQVWCGLCGGSGGVADPNWGGAQVWASTDNVTYQQIGTVTAPARMGVLLAALPAFAGSGEDTTDTLSVNLAESAGVLASGSGSDALLGQTLCWVDGEFLAYTMSTLTAVSEYTLSGLYRGLGGTTAALHAIGAPFLRCDDAVFKYTLPQSYVGQPLYLKFPSFNVFSGALQDISTCTAYTYTPGGTGFQIAAPTALALAAGSTAQADGTTLLTMTASWTASAGPLLGSYDVQWSADGGTTWGADATVGAQAVSAALSPALAATSYAVRVRAISQNGQAVSAWTTSGAVSSGAGVGSVPAAPTALTATAGAASATLAWTPAADPSVTAFRLYRAAGASAAFSSAVLVATASGSPWTDAGVAASTAYTWFVTAVNAAGESAASAGASCTTGAAGGVAIQNGGSAVGNAGTLNAGSGMGVSIAGGVATFTASGGTGGIVAYYAGTDTALAVSSPPTATTAIDSMTLTIPASSAVRRLMVNASVTWSTETHGMRGTLLLDGTVSFPASQSGRSGVNSIVAGEIGTTLQAGDGANFLGMAGVIVSIPGDGASHTVAMAWEDQAATSALTLFDRWIVGIVVG